MLVVRKCSIGSSADQTYGLLIDQSGPPFSVCHVEHSGAAFNAGLRVGDRVLKVGDKDVSQCTYIDVLNTISDRTTDQPLELLVSACEPLPETPIGITADDNYDDDDDSRYHQPSLSSNVSSATRIGGTRSVHFINIDDIGVLFDYEQGSGQVFIGGVKANYAGWYAGLNVGDIVGSVNGVKVSEKNFLKVLGSAKRSKRFELVVVVNSMMRSMGRRGAREERLCTITLPEDGSASYGFSLGFLSTGEHVIESVEANSNAFLAGLKAGDRLIEVNGVNVENRTHAFVVDNIKAAMRDKSSGGQLSLLVSHAKSSRSAVLVPFFDRKPVVVVNEPSSAQCSTASYSEFVDHYGFDFHTTPDAQHVIDRVVSGCALSLVGLRIGDRILEVNGVNAESYTNNELRIMLNRLNCEQLVLVVASEKNYRAVKQQFPITTKKFLNCGGDWLEGSDCGRAEIDQLTGIEILSSKDSDNAFKHIISQVNAGSFADIHLGDQLIQIGSTDVTKLDKQSVIDLMNEQYRARKLTMVLSSSVRLMTPNAISRSDLRFNVVFPRKFTIPKTDIDCFDFECNYDNHRSKSPILQQQQQQNQIDNYPVLTQVAKSSPISQAGVSVNDRLIAINGVDLQGFDKAKVLSLLSSDFDPVGILIEHSNHEEVRYRSVLKDTHNNGNRSKSMIDICSSSKLQIDQAVDGDDNNNNNNRLDAKTAPNQESPAPLPVRATEPASTEFSNTFNFDVHLSKSAGILGMTVRKHECGLLIVNSVLPDSAAWKAGIRENDVLIQINNIPLRPYHTSQFVSSLLSRLAKSDPIVSLIVKRSRFIRNVPKFSSTPDLSCSSEKRGKNDHRWSKEFSALEPVPRRCNLRLKDGSTDWGFTIRPAPNADCPMVYSLTPDSPAHKAGLAVNDRILAFDKISVQQHGPDWPDLYMSHCVRRRTVQLLVLTETAYKYYKRKGGVLKGEDLNIFDYEQPPSQCFTLYAPKLAVFQLKNARKSIGFSIQQIAPRVISSVEKNSMASRACVQQGDHIIEVNGINVETASYQTISKLISDSKSKCRSLRLLLAERNCYEWYKSKCVPLNSHVIFATTNCVDK